MQLIKITLFWLGTIIQLSDAQKTSELNAEEDDRVVLSCNLTDPYEYPAWNGPPSLATYTLEGINQISPSAQAGDRLSYATNKQDLVLDPAFKNDSGVYKCSVTSKGDHEITLEVLEKTTTTTATTTDCGCESLNNCDISKVVCIVIWIIIVIVIVVVIIGIVLLILHFVVGVRFPWGSKTEERKSTANKPQQSHEEAKQILEDGDRKETKSQKRPPVKLEQLGEQGSEKHHIGGRPLPEIGKYNKT